MKKSAVIQYITLIGLIVRGICIVLRVVTVAVLVPAFMVELILVQVLKISEFLNQIPKSNLFKQFHPIIIFMDWHKPLQMSLFVILIC
jgi:hypothetical protein